MPVALRGVIFSPSFFVVVVVVVFIIMISPRLNQRVVLRLAFRWGPQQQSWVGSSSG